MLLGIEQVYWLLGIVGICITWMVAIYRKFSSIETNGRETANEMKLLRVELKAEISDVRHGLEHTVRDREALWNKLTYHGEQLGIHDRDIAVLKEKLDGR